MGDHLTSKGGGTTQGSLGKIGQQLPTAKTKDLGNSELAAAKKLASGKVKG